MSSQAKPRPEKQESEAAPRRELLAFELRPEAPVLIEPAPVQRDWMEAMPSRAAHRCLPLLIANQAGWFISLTSRVEAIWNGGDGMKDIQVTREDKGAPVSAASHFGYGILTFHVPYLFRTPKGIALWARGPANRPKKNIVALEGIVETEWTPATFTMNWKFTRRNRPVVFEAGEPVCMVTPIDLALIESFDPVARPLGEFPSASAQYRVWKEERADLLANWGATENGRPAYGYQGDYMRGRGPGAGAISRHRTKLSLRKFARQEANLPPSESPSR
jgi:hypothetical protein